ncbi:MAG: hypothetical protein OEU94_07045 [Aquincola sp.]|nr:hypothetical protein [Aquincola sp.]MDH4287729.1 hypothetical protein [Aquincola sp.]MDH5330555.1 hypothetical protein [Aquincola sp.]
MNRVAVDCRLVRIASFAAGAWLLMAGAWAQGTGLALPPPAEALKFQARLGLNTSLSADGATAAWHQQAGVLLADYYFSRTRFGSGDVSGGFRATSGLLVGQRSMALGTPALAGTPGMSVTMLRQTRLAIPGAELASEAWATLPYVGVGWSGGSARGGWGVSADFGYAARTPGGGLRVTGTQTLDDVLREFRLTPVLHVGVSYAF